MEAQRIAELTVEIFNFLGGKNIDGAEKIAVLKSAAAILENVRAEETYKQSMAMHFKNMFNPQK